MIRTIKISDILTEDELDDFMLFISDEFKEYLTKEDLKKYKEFCQENQLLPEIIEIVEKLQNIIISERIDYFLVN